MRCACGRNAVLYKPHEGRWYCLRCLKKQVERKLNHNVRKMKLNRNDRAAVVIPPCNRFNFLFPYWFAHRRCFNFFELTAVCLAFNAKQQAAIERFFEKHNLDAEYKRMRAPRDCAECMAKQLRLAENAARSFARVMLPFTLEDATEKFLCLFASREFTHAIKTLNIVSLPLANLSRKELKACFRGAALPSVRCALEDACARVIERGLSRLEKKYHGIKYQTLSFIEKLRGAL